MAGWIDSGYTYGPGTKGKTNNNTNNNSNTNNSGSNSGSGTPSKAIGFDAPKSNGNSGVTVGASPSMSYDEEYAWRFGDDEDTSYDTNNAYLEKMLAQYEEAQAAQKKAIQAAVDQSVSDLNAQKTTTNQEYADAYRQLYINNMLGQKNINQILASQGKTGGASESTLLGMNTNYEDNLREGKVAQQNAIDELNRAITNAQLSGSIEAANTNAELAQNNANAYLTAWQNALTAQQNQASLKASQDSENRSYNYQMAMAMLQAGAMPSDDLLNSAGISKADAQTIVANYVAQKASSGSNPVADTSWKNGISSSGYYGRNSEGNSKKQEYQDEANDLAYQYTNSNGNISTVLNQLDKDYTLGKISLSTYKSLQNYYKNV